MHPVKYNLEAMANFASAPDELDDKLLHLMQQESFELGKLVRVYEKAFDREARRRLRERENERA